MQLEHGFFEAASKQLRQNRSAGVHTLLDQLHFVLPRRMQYVINDSASVAWMADAETQAPEFWRLRLGIGHPGDRSAVINYVLHTPGQDEMQLIEQGMDAGAAILPQLLAGRFEEAMLKLHTRK